MILSRFLHLVYGAVAKSLSKLQVPESENGSYSIVDAIEEIEILLDEEMDFLTCTLRDNRGKTIQSFDKPEEWMTWLTQIPKNRFDQFSPVLKSIILLNQLAQKLAQQSACIPQLIRVGIRQFKNQVDSGFIKSGRKIIV